MTSSASDASHTDSRTLAASLAPLAVQACEGRLGDITWFKTDWQRGGAATGKSTFKLDSGDLAPVVIKIPVVQRELMWTQRLQDQASRHQGIEASRKSESEIDDLRLTIDDSSAQSPIVNRQSEIVNPPVVPRLYACGETLGGYDLAWIVIERFPFGPLGVHWHDDHIPRVAEAAAQFHAAAARFEVDQPPRHEDWRELIAEASHSVKVNTPQHEQRWIAALKTMRHKLDAILKEWDVRPVNHWLHGDLHMANAMSREHNDHGPVCLIDLAEVHSGHWVEDAVYLERQLWARPQRMSVHKPVKAIAAARRALGLPVEPDYPRLAMIRRALLAATAPRFIKSEGHPAYLDACLERLEIAMNELK